MENANFAEAGSAQQQLTQERDQLRLLLDVGNAVVSTLDLRELMTIVSASLRRVMSHEYAIWLSTIRRNTLRDPRTRLPGRHGFLQEGLTVRVADAPTWPYETRDSADDQGGHRRSILICQGVLSEGLIGMFSAAHRSRAATGRAGRRSSTVRISPGGCGPAQPIANQIAIAVENSLGFTQIVDLATD
jgi:hypothetical protein